MRWNTASAYLRPALARPEKNLAVESGVLVTKILFDGKKATGIEYIQKGQVKRAYAENEVRQPTFSLFWCTVVLLTRMKTMKSRKVRARGSIQALLIG